MATKGSILVAIILWIKGALVFTCQVNRVGYRLLINSLGRGKQKDSLRVILGESLN